MNNNFINVFMVFIKEFEDPLQSIGTKSAADLRPIRSPHISGCSVIDYTAAGRWTGVP